MSNEVIRAQKLHMKKLGYKNIKVLLQEETCINPASASDDRTSNSITSICPRYISECTVFAKMWLSVNCVDWNISRDKFNECVQRYNNDRPKTIKEFTKCEFLTCFSLFIGATLFIMSGVMLWNNNETDKNGHMGWDLMIQPPGFEKYIKLNKSK